MRTDPRKVRKENTLSLGSQPEKENGSKHRCMEAQGSVSPQHKKRSSVFNTSWESLHAHRWTPGTQGQEEQVRLLWDNWITPQELEEMGVTQRVTAGGNMYSGFWHRHRPFRGGLAGQAQGTAWVSLTPKHENVRTQGGEWGRHDSPRTNGIWEYSCGQDEINVSGVKLRITILSVWDKAPARPWRHTACSHLHCTQKGAESLLHGKQLTRSERSDGRGERGEFACSFPTRSDSQKQWDFMNKLNERKVSYLQAEDVRKEEAAGGRDSSLLHTVRPAPPSQDKGGTVHMSSCCREQTAGAQGPSPLRMREGRTCLKTFSVPRRISADCTARWQISLTASYTGSIL